MSKNLKILSEGSAASRKERRRSLDESKELSSHEEESSGQDTGRSDVIDNSDETPRSNYSDDYDDDDDEDDVKRILKDDDDDDDDDDDVDGSLSESQYSTSRKHSEKHKKYRNSDEILPPEILLRKSRKKAALYIKKGKNDSALRELIRCVVLVRLVEGEGHWKLAKSHVRLASAYLDLKGYAAQAVYHCEQAQDTVIRHVRISDYPQDKTDITEMLIEMQYTMGKALTLLNKLSEAEIALTKAEKFSDDFSKLQTVTDDEIDDWNVKICLAMGRLSFKQEKHAVALTYYEKALKITINQHGKDSILLIPIYQNLGKVEQSKGKQADHSRAVEFYLQAHSIAVTNYDTESMEAADTGYALALAYAAVGDLETDNSAEGYLLDVITVYERNEGSGSSKVLEVQDELARLYMRTDRIEEGISLLRSTLKYKQELYGDLSAQVADTWKLIGSSHLSIGESEKALQSLKKCHTIQCSVHGKNHRKTADTQRIIDLLSANNGASNTDKKGGSTSSRPRFNGVARTPKALGGFKPSLY